MFTFIGNLFIIMFLFGLFNFTIYAFKVRSVVRKHKDNPNVRGVKIVNGEVEIIEDNENVLEAQVKEEIKDTVTDLVCNEEVEKAKAFHVIKNGESHYFCSWDCRDKFLESANKEHL